MFRNLTPQDPEQRYVITMDVSEQNQWAGMVSGQKTYEKPYYMLCVSVPPVVSMEPHVSGVRALLNDLNKTGKFSQFCKAVRSKFKQYCTDVAT